MHEWYPGVEGGERAREGRRRVALNENCRRRGPLDQPATRVHHRAEQFRQVADRTLALQHPRRFEIEGGQSLQRLIRVLTSERELESNCVPKVLSSKKDRCHLDDLGASS